MLPMMMSIILMFHGPVYRSLWQNLWDVLWTSTSHYRRLMRSGGCGLIQQALELDS